MKERFIIHNTLYNNWSALLLIIIIIIYLNRSSMNIIHNVIDIFLQDFQTVFIINDTYFISH